MAYDEKLIDHYENPRNVGTLDKADETVGTGWWEHPRGDVMRLQIKVNDEGVVEDAKFKTFGCGSAIVVIFGHRMGKAVPSITLNQSRTRKSSKSFPCPCKGSLLSAR